MAFKLLTSSLISYFHYWLHCLHNHRLTLKKVNAAWRVCKGPALQTEKYLYLYLAVQFLKLENFQLMYLSINNFSFLHWFSAHEIRVLLKAFLCPPSLSKILKIIKNVWAWNSKKLVEACFSSISGNHDTIVAMHLWP